MQGSRKNTRVLILNYQRHVQTIHKRKYINDKLEKKKNWHHRVKMEQLAHSFNTSTFWKPQKNFLKPKPQWQRKWERIDNNETLEAGKKWLKGNCLSKLKLNPLLALRSVKKAIPLIVPDNKNTKKISQSAIPNIQ